MDAPVVILPARALGDGVLALTLARNLHAAGREAILHHTALVELRAWAGWARIEAPPEGEELARCLAAAPALFLGDPAWARGAPPAGQTRVVFDKASWDRDRPYLRSLERACAPAFGITTWRDDCALAAPQGSPPPAVPDLRIAFHPTSARAQKNWPADRWVALGARLRDEGWQPEVLLAAGEEAAWRAAAGDELPVAVPGRLDAVAAWLAGCAACVATDSGIAHLASALGTPTLALFRKRSAARFWAPAFGRSAVVTAPWRLPGGGGHRLWGRLLGPRRVQAALRSLLRGA